MRVGTGRFPPKAASRVRRGGTGTASWERALETPTTAKGDIHDVDCLQGPLRHCSGRGAGRLRGGHHRQIRGDRDGDDAARAKVTVDPHAVFEALAVGAQTEVSANEAGSVTIKRTETGLEVAGVAPAPGWTVRSPRIASSAWSLHRTGSLLTAGRLTSWPGGGGRSRGWRPPPGPSDAEDVDLPWTVKSSDERQPSPTLRRAEGWQILRCLKSQASV